MFGPFVDSFEWLRARSPERLFKERKLSFITIHYVYIISLAMIASALILPNAKLSYIDALFFATGAATQSGLNTIDLNLLNTYQQIVVYLVPMIASPIFINSVVVLVRLYWFEKRFQHVVRDARDHRRTLSRSKTSDSGRDNPSRLERGVDGRNIQVMHDDNTSPKITDGRSMLEKAESKAQIHGSLPESKEISEITTSPVSSITNEGGALASPKSAVGPTVRRDITFADEIPNSASEEGEDRLSSMSEPQMHQQHIAFLQRQRDLQNIGTLRIPGPRDFDRGDKPEDVATDSGDGEISRQIPGGPEAYSPTTHRRKLSFSDDSTQAHGNTHSVNRSDPTEDSKIAPEHLGTPLSDLRIRRPHALSKTLSNVTKVSGKLRRSSTLSSLRGTASNAEAMTYLSWAPTVGRNSAFVDLTQEQREELGGIEYRALKTLIAVLGVYYVGFHLLGAIAFIAFGRISTYYGSIIDADGTSRVWWGFFTPASMMNNVGFTLTPDSMIPFQEATLPLLLGSFLIIIGNTGFPCMLRLIIWLTAKVVPRGGATWEELNFLLDHPRRCFTLLFPSKATWWLFWILALLNGIDLLFFIVLDLDDPTVTALKPGYRVLNGWFQATSTRTAGLACVSLANLHPAIQVSYLIMMYISVFPIAISVRRTNVYEEKSLGIYGSPSGQAEDRKEPSYVAAHLRKQLSFDLWYVFLGLFVITIAEARRIQNVSDAAFSIFAILFEIVSAYGTVGLSLGYPNVNASFSIEFSTVSKLVIIAMQIRGRHRGLPNELDRAILLPSDSLHLKEDEDAIQRQILRRPSNETSMDPPDLGADLGGRKMTRRASNLSQLEASGRGLFSRVKSRGGMEKAVQEQRDPHSAQQTTAEKRLRPVTMGHAEEEAVKIQAQKRE